MEREINHSSSPFPKKHKTTTTKNLRFHFFKSWLIYQQRGENGIFAVNAQGVLKTGTRNAHSFRFELLQSEQQWSQDWKRSVCIVIQKKGNAKEYSDYDTIALISHASKVMLKILQASLQ